MGHQFGNKLDKKIPFLIFLFLHLMQIYSVLVQGFEFLNTYVLLCFILFVVCAGWINQPSKIRKSTFIYCLSVIGLIFLSIAWQLVMDENIVGPFDRQSHSWLISVSVSSIVWFLLGICLANNVHKLNLYTILFFNASLLIIFYLSVESIFKGIVFQAGNSQRGIQTFNHLFVSSSLLILIFTSVYSLKSSPILLNMFFPIWFLMLFLIQSRSSLLIFVIVFFFFLLKQKKWKYLGPFFLQLAFYVVFLAHILDASLLSSRFSLSEGILNDESVSARISGIFDLNFLSVNQLFMGSVYNIVMSTGGFGGYAHNYLSMLQIYGIFPFILTPCLLYLKLINGKNRLMNENSFVWLLLVFSIVALVLSQSVVYKLPWFAFGLVVGLKYEKLTL